MKETLYYGTDTRFFTMAKEHLHIYENICRLVINDLFPKFSPYYAPCNNHLNEMLGKEILGKNPTLYKELSWAMFQERALRVSQKPHSYHVSTIRLFAYADAINSIAGGSLGKVAYILVKAADCLNWFDWEKEDDEMKRAKVVKMIAEGESKPIILSFNKYNDEIRALIDEEDNCLFDTTLYENDFDILIKEARNSIQFEEVDKDFNKEIDKKNNCIPYLYHGTDARIVKMTQKERNDYIDYCNLAIEYLGKLFEPYYSSYETQQTIINGHQTTVQIRKIETYKPLFEAKNKMGIYNNLIEKLWMIETGKNGNQQYQYGDLYLTSHKIKATDYAFRSFAGGELGLIAQRLLLAAEVMELELSNLDIRTRKAIDTIKSFAGNPDDSCPIIIKVPNIDVKYLSSDKGEPLEWITDDHFVHQDFRYTKEIELSLEDAEYLKNK